MCVYTKTFFFLLKNVEKMRKKERFVNHPWQSRGGGIIRYNYLRRVENLKKILVVFMILCTLCLTSCGARSKYNKCEDHFKTHLVSPKSFKCKSVVGYKLGKAYAFKISYTDDGYTDVVKVAIDKDGEVVCTECSKSVYAQYASGLYSQAEDEGKQIYKK